MANEEQYDCYDADADVMRYLLDPTTDISMFSEPVVVTVAVAVESHPTPAIHVVERPAQVQISQFDPLSPPPTRMVHGQQHHPVPDLDLRSEIHVLKEHRPPAPPSHLHPHPVPDLLVIDGNGHHHTTVAVLDSERMQTRPALTTAAARQTQSSPPDGLFAASPDDDELDTILNSFRDEATHGDSGGGAACIDVLVPVEQDANSVPFLPLRPGQLDCSRCHLVRHVMHITASRTVKLFVHSAAPGTFEHAIVDRSYTAANGQITMEEQLYIDLSKWTREWASEFIHTAAELNLLQSITSAPSADHQNGNETTAEVAGPAAQPFSAAPPVALPPKAAPKARKKQDYASMLLAVEEFYVAATSPPIPKSDVEILESSHVAQQDGGRAIIYPSLQARRGKKQAVPRTSTAEDVVEYLSLARKETEKEINTLSSFDEIYRNDGMLSYLMTEVRRLNRKIWRLQKNAPSTLPSRLSPSMKEIDDIKVEKRRVYAQFISALKMLCRKKMDDGGSAQPINNNNN
uniref:Uncharacterized protein n=1 Tax=Oryza punctata TaxID=4537 RepID=A0A0E0LTF1_ORYPU